MLFASRVAHIPGYRCDGRLLDVGSGAGQYVWAMRDLGWNAFGLEPAMAMSEESVQGPSPFVAGWAEQLPFAPAQFDCVTFWHSLEHTADPRAALEEARRVLRPDGLLMLEVPNLDSLQARVFGRFWVHLDPPRHRYHFTPPALRRMLQLAGFTDITIRLRPSAIGWEGSIRISWTARGKGCRGPWRFLRPIGLLAAGLEQMMARGGCIEATARPAPIPRMLGGEIPASPPRLSVIIVSWNCRQARERCLASLAAALKDIPSEIIIADNGSSDGTVEWLSRHAAGVRVLSFEDNLGFAAAANERALQELGVRRVSSPRRGKVSEARRAHQRQFWFRRLQKWRAGGEATISVLKRKYGLGRSRFRGRDGTRTWVGFGVLSYNLHRLVTMG